MPESSNELQRSRDSDFLCAAFGLEGCPVCTAVLEYIKQSIDNWEYEGFTDVANRHQLIRPAATDHPTLYQGCLALDLEALDLQEAFVRINVYTTEGWRWLPVRFSEPLHCAAAQRSGLA